MEAGKVIRIVRTACHPDDEEKFNRWYNDVHVPHVLTHPGSLAATRCKVMDPEGSHPEYITIYEFSSQEAFEDYEKLRNGPEWKAELVKVWGHDPNGGPAGADQRGFHAISHLNSRMIRSWRK